MAAQGRSAAIESERTADVLTVFRNKVPEYEPYFTTLIANLHLISDRLTRLHEAVRHPQYSASIFRVDPDILLVISSLRQTQQTVLDNIGRTRSASYSRVWGDLTYHMDNTEGVGFHQRLQWYIELLTAALQELLESNSTTDRGRLLQETAELLQKQISLNRRPVMFTRTVEAPLTPAMSPDRERPMYPIAPEVPLSPLSPTLTTDSSRTHDSSHTSYSDQDPYFPPPHWARDVFDGAYPVTPFRRNYDALEKSRCVGDVTPDALTKLQIEGFYRALELSFDDETAWVRLYYRPGDGRARLLFLSNRTTCHCIPLMKLRAIRGRSELQLCRVRSSGRLELWALLNFAAFERLALFYSTFVAMKRQDRGDTVDGRMIEDLEQLHETVHFHGMIRHGDMVHALRLLQDVPSGVYRLEASPLRGSMRHVPLWTAFITKYKDKGEEDWAELRPGTSQVLLAAFKPKPYVFTNNYRPPKYEHEWLLDFVHPEDAKLFLEKWIRLCRTSG